MHRTSHRTRLDFAGPLLYFDLADRQSRLRIAQGKTRTDAAEIFLAGRGQACPRGIWGVPRGGQYRTVFFAKNQELIAGNTDL